MKWLLTINKWMVSFSEVLQSFSYVMTQHRARGVHERLFE